MEKSKDQIYLDDFVLTRSEMAKELGITTNALKCRMRKGHTEGLNFRHDGEKFVFKRLRGNQHVRPKGRWHDGNKKKKDWSDVRRGTTHIGEAKYPNEHFKKHNELKILNRISKEVPQYVLDKINPRLLTMAQQEYKNEILGKNQGTFNEPKYYGGSVNTEIHRHYENNFRMKLGEPQDTSFNIRGSRPRETPWNNPYEIGLPTNDGSVEIDPRNFPKDNAEPVFKNKIEEAIYRAKRK